MPKTLRWRVYITCKLKLTKKKEGFVCVVGRHVILVFLGLRQLFAFYDDENLWILFRSVCDNGGSVVKQEDCEEACEEVQEAPE